MRGKSVDRNRVFSGGWMIMDDRIFEVVILVARIVMILMGGD